MIPTSAARVVTILVVAILLAGCSRLPTSSGDLDLRTGCPFVVAQRAMVGSDVVMDVQASSCRNPDGVLLPSEQAVDRLAQAVWQSLELPVDAIHVEVSAPAFDGDGTATITSKELSERFGSGPSGVVWPVSDRPNEIIWVMLPIGYLATGLVMLLFARRLRRAGVVVVLLRR
jgi:hypothetical protein